MYVCVQYILYSIYVYYYIYLYISSFLLVRLAQHVCLVHTNIHGLNIQFILIFIFFFILLYDSKKKHHQKNQCNIICTQLLLHGL